MLLSCGFSHIIALVIIMENNLPKRKHTRLKHYDYSSAGAYFITICTKDRRCLLWNHVGATIGRPQDVELSSCGEIVSDAIKRISSIYPALLVGRGLAPAEIQYTAYGQIAQAQLLLLEQRYPSLKIDRYVIMPNHIHAIMLLEEVAGASQRPAITDIICAYKSLTTRQCKKVLPIDKLFQASFYEHVIRNREDYQGIAEYIDHNPKQWELDRLYVKDE